MEAYHLWLIGGLLLAAGEMLLGDFTLLCIGVATGSTAIPALMGWSLELSFAWFAVALLILFMTLRPAMRRYFMADSPNLASNVSSLVGDSATVKLEDGVPWSNVGGDHWRLECDESLADGQSVKVIAIEGSRLRVEPV